MDLASLITDSVTEMLVKIIEFTEARQKILTQNISNIQRLGFEPKDLNVNEFSDLLNNAVNEYIKSRRLILRDTENIKFGPNGNFQVKPIVDKHAKNMLKKNRDKYLDIQTNKLMENSLNKKLATELLRQKEGMIPTFD